jgi:hypothetical protein
MGFFGNISKNLKRGGVKVRLDAPASIKLNSKEQYTARVSITAKEPQKINDVTLTLRRQTIDSNNAPSQEIEIMSINTGESFELTAGETKVVEIKYGADMAKISGVETDAVTNAVSEAMAKFGAIAQALDNDRHEYFLIAQADVDGVSLDPTNQMMVHVQEPGEIGGATEFHT